LVVVDLPSTLRGNDHERIARVDVFEQLVEARMDHVRVMVAAPFSSRWTIPTTSLAAPLAVVVLVDVIELAGELLLLPRDGDPLADLPRALGRPLAQPALELLERGR